VAVTGWRASRLAIPALLLLALASCAAPRPEDARGAEPAYPGLDDGDLALLAATLQKTLETVPSGERREWQNPESGRRGTIRPLRTYRNAGGFYCRDFEERYAAATPVDRIRVACRDSDGRWLIAFAGAS
jgi:hypothetical protein